MRRDSSDAAFAGIAHSRRVLSFGDMSAAENTAERKGQSGTRRKIIFAISVLVLLAGGVFGMWWLAKQKAAHERSRWKGPALERLASLTTTNETVQEEIADLMAGPTPNIDRGWIHDHVLLMTNGEHIVYAYRHGANNGFVDHLFLGRGSDGRWLYSSFHFCNSMAMISGENPPGSIVEFAERYAVREFDGRSDDCLQRTWPQDRTKR
jgi:hypothetical protein